MFKVQTELDAKAVDMAGALNISSLPAQTIAGLRHLPTAPAVYFCVLNNRVVYIGGTINLKLRWKDHSERRVLRRGGHVAWLLVDRHMVRAVERAMIHEFAPPMNNHHTEIGRGVRMKGLGGAHRALQFLIAQEKQ